jgi:hypothetical protein
LFLRVAAAAHHDITGIPAILGQSKIAELNVLLVGGLFGRIIQQPLGAGEAIAHVELCEILARVQFCVNVSVTATNDLMNLQIPGSDFAAALQEGRVAGQSVESGGLLYRLKAGKSGLYPRCCRPFSMETQELRMICAQESSASPFSRSSFH